MHSTQDLQRTFFKMLFGQVVVGHVCIAVIDRTGERKRIKEYYYPWPKGLDEMVEKCSEVVEGHDVYFCPQILSTAKRDKDHVKYCTAVWADLDTCDPANMLVEPSIAVESSPGRYQAYWLWEEPAEPIVAEDVSKRIAYKHAKEGADISGWDLSQLLRVPYTNNYKRMYDTATPNEEPDRVKIITFQRKLYRLADFLRYPEARGVEFQEMPPPEAFPQGGYEEILANYKGKFPPSVWSLIQDEPTRLNAEGKITWSEDLWKLLLLLFEAGLTREETFAIVKVAKCNKYERDGRPDSQLWRDVSRAYQQHMRDINIVVVPENVLRPILTDEEAKLVEGRHTFVERYIEWASSLGDAAPQYHQAGAFVILSALLAGRVVLQTSYGKMLPNLWFMILADTTLTRKSTAMDISVDLLMEVDPDAIMATADGSIEGLLTGLSTRPARPSVFLRDEVTGLLESMTKKDYMAGMAELLTKLYDGRSQRRLLRKETIDVRDPVLIVFAGGIRHRMQALVTLEHVSSGFLPRFVFLTATSDVSKIRPLGPPSERDLSNKEFLLEEMRDMVRHYHVTQETIIKATGVTIPAPRVWNAEVSPDAWQRYAAYELGMLQTGLESERPDIMTPIYDRLAKSTLKAAVLLAAAESRENKVVVEVIHLLQAMKYADKWREYAVDIINGVGKTADERDVERIFALIKKRPGIGRGQIMQTFHLSAAKASALFTTLEQRGMIYSQNYGRATTYHPAE